MNNIVLIRIDDRLIHGQVVTSVDKGYKPETGFLIVDDNCGQ